MKFTKRETAAVLCGLRRVQREILKAEATLRTAGRGGAPTYACDGEGWMSEDKHHTDGVAFLSSVEIDRLCERINVG